MAGRDNIEIEQGGRTLRGTGSLRVSTATMRNNRPAVPYVEGVVTFDDRVTFDDLERMTDAVVRCALADGTSYAFGQAVMMRAVAGAKANSYTIWLDCYLTKPS